MAKNQRKACIGRRASAALVTPLWIGPILLSLSKIRLLRYLNHIAI